MKTQDLWLDQCHFGDVAATMRAMIADGVKVQTMVTSPPYWGLRSYLPDGHPDKHLEIGQEPTLREFIDKLVGVFDLCRDLLTDDGTLWLNMGDSYSGGGCGARDDVLWPKQSRNDHMPVHAKTVERTGLKAKNLTGQPWRLAFALQDAGWYLRQDIIWHKPNPMPESVADRCTKSHEYLFLLSKGPRYYFDAAAIAEASSPESASRYERGRSDSHKWADGGPGDQTIAKSFDHMRGSKRNNFARETKYSDGGSGQKAQHRPDREDVDYSNTRNKRSVWTIATQPYSGAHFATFPEKLVEPCILAGSRGGGYSV